MIIRYCDQCGQQMPVYDTAFTNYTITINATTQIGDKCDECKAKMNVMVPIQ